MKKYKTIKKLLSFVAVVIALIIFLYYQNNSIVTTKLEIVSNKVPDEFNGYKILQISDLHSKRFGSNQKILVNKAIKTKPNLIVITGDLIDAKKYDEDVCIDLISQIIQIAPVYFVTGNHEAWSQKFDGFEKRLKEAGVIVLRNEHKVINIENSSILIMGMDDPAFGDVNIPKDMTGDTKSLFSILLSHRPELIDSYAKENIDLVFSGHAHGGQIRLPFIGGLIAPNQGLFPEYTSGPYRRDNTIMVVNRGLGNSIIPQRIFNRPEIILVTLQNKQIVNK